MPNLPETVNGFEKRFEQGDEVTYSHTEDDTQVGSKRDSSTGDWAVVVNYPGGDAVELASTDDADDAATVLVEFLENYTPTSELPDTWPNDVGGFDKQVQKTDEVRYSHTDDGTVVVAQKDGMGGDWRVSATVGGAGASETVAASLGGIDEAIDAATSYMKSYTADEESGGSGSAGAGETTDGRGGVLSELGSGLGAALARSDDGDGESTEGALGGLLGDRDRDGPSAFERLGGDRDRDGPSAFERLGGDRDRDGLSAFERLGGDRDRDGPSAFDDLDAGGRDGPSAFERLSEGRGRDSSSGLFDETMSGSDGPSAFERLSDDRDRKSAFERFADGDDDGGLY